jgi:hypothetical protein
VYLVVRVALVLHAPGSVFLTIWHMINRAIEALTRAGDYDKAMLAKAVAMFEDFLQYSNHVNLYTEEISTSGEGLGNAVQGFT